VRDLFHAVVSCVFKSLATVLEWFRNSFAAIRHVSFGESVSAQVIKRLREVATILQLPKPFITKTRWRSRLKAAECSGLIIS
jgi:hypothetical protein